MDPSPGLLRSTPVLVDGTTDIIVGVRAGTSLEVVSDDPPKSPSTVEPPITTVHLARFEFSDHGTKILMVEWHPGASTDSTSSDHDVVVDSVGTVNPESNSISTSQPEGKQPPINLSTSNDSPINPAADVTVWQVSWPGKSTFLPARDTDQDGARRRVYFLLPPGAPVPPTVTIARPGAPSLVLKPLPAIFPERFEAESGARGVLHTIWAKKRLSELEREMAAELRTNAESVGLEMALAEKNWIIENFLRPNPPAQLPKAPRSSVPNRLGDKLKGLRLATSPADLVPNPTANTFTGAGNQFQAFSPVGGDIAISSFAAISHSNPTGTLSLNSAIHNHVAPQRSESIEAEDDLFALPMSPRSPDMKKSPFSALGAGPL